HTPDEYEAPSTVRNPTFPGKERDEAAIHADEARSNVEEKYGIADPSCSVYDTVHRENLSLFAVPRMVLGTSSFSAAKRMFSTRRPQADIRRGSSSPSASCGNGRTAPHSGA